MTSRQAWLKPLQIAVILSFGLSPATSFAMSESRTFFAGKIYDERPQLCNVAGTGCGKRAADTWCQQAGYEHAMSFRIAHEERQRARAQLVGNGELCAEDTCNGFHLVKCQRNKQQ